jgi:hypothetical protein
MSMNSSTNAAGKGIRDLPFVAQCLNKLHHCVLPDSKVLNKIFALKREKNNWELKGITV